MYSREEIEKVRAAADIVEVIREYVPSIKVQGRSVKGLCPFHNERTPSFHVQPDRGFFKCFGCGEGGDVITFVSKIENVGFSEALEKLAGQFGVTLKKSFVRNEQEPEGLRDKILRALESAKSFYSEQLWDEHAGKGARAYLKERGIKDETVQEFHLGFSPEGSSSLLEFLLKKNFTVDVCQQAGLVSRSQAGTYYDPLFGRLIFPIFDSFGHVVGFGGRVLPQSGRNIPGLSDLIKDSEAPKYINSPETPVFSKGRMLYGLLQAKASITEHRRVVVLEGYMDVIGTHQGGFKSTVASLGTALTRDHAKVLRRYADEGVLFFDPDEAGRQAALRGLEPLLQENLFPRVVLDKGTRDPDEIILEEGLEFFEGMVKDAPDFVDYILTVKSGEGLLNLQQRSQLAGMILEIIGHSTNEILKSEWMRKVANRLGIGMEALVRQSAERPSLHRRELGSVPEAPTKKERTLSTAEEEYLQVIFSQGKSLEETDLNIGDLLEGRNRRLFELIKRQLSEKGQVSFPALHDEMPEDDREWLHNLLLNEQTYADPSERKEQLVKDIRSKRDRKRLKMLSDLVSRGVVKPEEMEEYRLLLRRVKGSEGRLVS